MNLALIKLSQYLSPDHSILTLLMVQAGILALQVRQAVLYSFYILSSGCYHTYNVLFSVLFANYVIVHVFQLAVSPTHDTFIVAWSCNS